MSKKLLLLLIIFVLVCIAFIVIRKNFVPNTSSYTSIFKLSPTPVSENIISLSPNPLSAVAGKEAAAQVVLETKGDTPSLVQFEVAYEPGFLANVHVAPGDFFEEPTVILNKVNPNTGRISYALQSQTQLANKARGTVAVIYFTPLSSVTETELTFLPKTMIRTSGEQNTLKVGYGTQIQISPMRATQASSSAAILQ